MPPEAHPSEAQLRAYALGDLVESAVQGVEAHVLACAACQATVREVRDELVRLTDALPPVEPGAGTWRAVEDRVRGRGGLAGGRPWLAAASVAILALGSWGGWQVGVNAALRHDQQVIAGWLSRPDVKVLPLSDREQRLRGRILLAADRTALFVLPPPPPGLRYHAWISTKSGWKFGDPLRLAQSSADGVFQVAVGNTDYLCVSLERDAHPARPVVAHILGFVFL